LVGSRLDELVEMSSSDVPFDKQVLVVLRQNRKSTNYSPFPDYENITEVVGIARNTSMNAYCISRLDINLHFSASFAQFFMICKRIIELQGSSQAGITFIPSSMESYCSSDSKTIVFNDVPNLENIMLNEVRDQMYLALDNGLLQCLRCSDSGRSGKSEKKNSPVIHTGFTNSNCGVYSSHRHSQMGHVDPSLIKSYLQDASLLCKQQYGKAIALQNSVFSQSPDVFGVGKTNNVGNYAAGIHRKYCEYFGLNELRQDSEEYCELLKNTATTALFNNHIDHHVDSLNDPSEGNCAVICFSMMIKRKSYEEDISAEQKEWLDYHGYTENIPFCNLNYSRKVCVQASTRSDKRLDKVGSNDSNLYNLRTAINDAIRDTESITNYAATFERLNGLQFNEIEDAMNCFTHSQRSIQEAISRGLWEDVYKDCISSMGEGVHRNKDDVFEKLKSKRVQHRYDWKNDCHSHLFGKNYVPICMNPQLTYQGPKISLTASYDINRYHSLNIDAYRDIHTNIGLNSLENKLAFVIFAAVQCNSTLPVAELVRIMSMEEWKIKNDLYGRKYCESFWDLIIDVSETFKFKKVGSSHEQRFQFSSQGHIFEFKKYSDAILQQFEQFAGVDDSSELFEVYLETLKWIKKNVRCIGHILGIKFLQLSSFVGLLPLEVSTFASVETGGPAKLLKIFCEDSTNAFQELHTEFSEVWGNKFTASYFENMLCELQRELQATTGQKQSSVKDVQLLHRREGGYIKKHSKKKDHIVLYSHRGLENCISNLYRTSVNLRGERHIEVQSFDLDFHSGQVRKKDLIAVKDLDDKCLDHLYYN